MVTKTPKFLKRPWSRHLTHQYAYWVYGVIILLLSIIAAQLFYPYEHALPLARVGEVSVTGKSHQEIITLLRERYSDVPLTIKVPHAEPLQTSTAKAGLTPRYDEATNAVTEYSRTARFIPFSFVYKMLSSRTAVQYDIEAERFNHFADELVRHCERAPRDAALGFSAGQVMLKGAETGQRCEKSAIRQALSSLSLMDHELSVAVEPVPVAPTRTDELMRRQLVEAQALVSRGLTIGSPDKEWVVPKEELASWLTVEPNEAQELNLVLVTKKVRAYLKRLDSELVIAPGTTAITYQDGLETTRDKGEPGRVVDVEQTQRRVAEALFDSSSEPVAWVHFTDVAPQIQERRTYTKTARGVQALLEQWDRTNAGTYGIIVRDLSGRGLNGQVYPGRDFVTASTFKMFLAYATLHFAEAGQFKLSDRTSIGLSVQACIDEMIVHSTNECATVLMDKVGWSRTHNFIRGQFPSTSLDNGANHDGEKHTTVRDETTFLQRLATYQLEMSRSHHDYLLGLMKRQIYRGGIPAGLPGVTVANKVGFYNGYKHDVAIVYGPKGVYIVAVLSYGGSDWRFADLSRRVAELLH